MKLACPYCGKDLAEAQSGEKPKLNLGFANLGFASAPELYEALKALVERVGCLTQYLDMGMIELRWTDTDPSAFVKGQPAHLQSLETALKEARFVLVQCENLKAPLLDDDDDEGETPATECERCGDTGKVPTKDHESYLGANFKPCPKCGGDPCIGEPPTS